MVCRTWYWFVGSDFTCDRSLCSKSNRIGAALDHNVAQWAAWIGRPLAGQWVEDLQVMIGWVVAAYDQVPGVTLVTRGAAIVPGVIAAGLQTRVKQLVTLDAPLTLVSERAYGPGQIALSCQGCWQLWEILAIYCLWLLETRLGHCR